MFSLCSGMSSRSGCRSAPTTSPWGNTVGKWPDRTCHHTAEQVTPPFHPGVHKIGRETAAKQNQIKSNQSPDSCIDSYITIYIILPLLFFSHSSPKPISPSFAALARSTRPQSPTQFAQKRHKKKSKMFQQRAAQRLLTTLRPHVTRRMIATQHPKAVQATVSKGEFFTSVIAFSGATGVILACVTAPSSSS